MLNREVVSEQAKYDVIWRDYPNYRECSPGEALVGFFLEAFSDKIRAGQTLIDFGCGTGRVAKEFLAKGLNVSLVDISPYSLDNEIRSIVELFPTQISFVQACLWELPESLKIASWIYCCNVLEHIPESQIDRVLVGIAKRMRYGGYFSISLEEDGAKEHIGQSLHLTVRDRNWWEAKLLKYFDIAGEDLILDGIYYNCRVTKKETV